MPTFGATIKIDRHNQETNRLRIGIRGKMVVAIVHLVGWHKSCERLEIISREYVTEEVQEGNHNSLSPQMWCSCWRIRTTIRLANSYSKPTSFRQNWSFWCPYTKTSAKCRRILQAKTIFCLWQVWWGIIRLLLQRIPYFMTASACNWHAQLARYMFHERKLHTLLYFTLSYNCSVLVTYAHDAGAYSELLLSLI